MKFIFKAALFLLIVRLCSSCGNQCQTCSATDVNHCLTCYDSQFRGLTQSNSCACLKYYVDKYYYYVYVDICQACHFSCTTCYWSYQITSCLSCDAPTRYQTNNNHCLCNPGYFEQGVHLCGTCDPTCLTCDSTATSCTTCNSQRTLQASKACTCQTGFGDSGSGNCGPCHATCLTCFDITNAGCSTCDSNLLRVFAYNSCICQQGHFQVGTICSGVCDPSCVTCSQTATSCTTCNVARTLQLNKQCTCQVGYGDIGSGNCGACHSSCLTCSDTTKAGCLTCDSTKIRTLQSTSCLCQIYYYDIGTCLPCDYSCKTCKDESNTSCLTCDTTLFRVFKSNTSCSCSQGYFDSGVPTCEVCDQSCQTCSGTSTGCQTCDATRFRVFSQNSCICLQGYYQNGQTCGACHYSCATCTQSTNKDCSSCDAKVKRNFLSNSCPCSSGYVDSGSSACLSCHYTCDQCSSTASTGCSSCIAKNFRTYSGLNNTCQCNTGYLEISVNSPKCSITCDVTCLTCSDSSIHGCLTCNGVSPQFRTHTTNNMCQCLKQFKLINGVCVYVNCTVSQYYDENQQNCGNCDQTCSTCSGSSIQQCLSCDSTSKRSLDQGYCQCAVGYLAQQDQVLCTSENKNWYIIDTCSDGYQVGSKCLNCHPLCSKCTGGSALDCTSCQTSDYDEVNTNQNGQQYYQNSNINLILIMKSFVCQGSTSKQLTVFDNVTVTITGINAATNKVDYQSTFDSLDINVPKQTFRSGQLYEVQVEVKMTQLQQLVKTKFNLQIIQVPKIVTLAGGNMVVGNTKDLIISCRIFDFDNQDTPTDPTLYTFTWTCNPINYDIQCVNRQGLILDTSSTNQNFTITANDLAPYNTYQIHVAVFDIVRNIKYNSSAVYQIVNLNVPQLRVSYDPNILALTVNLNLEQQFEYDYQLKGIDPDNLFYSANLLYNFDVVSTIIYHYPTVNFRIWDYFEKFTQASGTNFQFTAQVYNPGYLIPSVFTLALKVNIPPQQCQILVTPDQGQELVDLFLIQILHCQSTSFVFTYRFAYYQSQTDYDHDNQYQTLVKASLLTPFQSSNQLSTYLPKSIGGIIKYLELGSDIILVLSVQDNLGGVSNYTKNINVNLIPQIEETQLIRFINQITDGSAQLRYLQVISVTLSNSNQTFPKLLPLITQLVAKANLYPLSEEQKNQVLQIQAFTSSQTEDLSSLILQQQSTSGSLINQIKKTQSFTKANPSTILNQQVHDTNIIVNAQIDSQHILGTIILQNLNSQQNTSLEKNSSHFKSINHQNKNVMVQLNNSRQIKLQQMTINQGTKLLKSKYATSAVALATKSKLNDMLGQNIIDDTQTGFLSDQSEESVNDHFSFSYLQYSGNPYSSDEKFPYPDQGFSAIDLQIAKQSKNTVQSQSPTIAPSKQVAFIINQKKNHRILPSVNNTISNTSKNDSRQNTTNMCVSNVQTKGWTASECQTITQSGKITCQCTTINPTSVVADFHGLFSDANTQIFSLNAIGAIAHFDWTKVILFWLIVAITSIFVISVPLGWRKDNVERKLDLDNTKQVDHPFEQDRDNAYPKVERCPSQPNDFQNGQIPIKNIKEIDYSSKELDRGQLKDNSHSNIIKQEKSGLYINQSHQAYLVQGIFTKQGIMTLHNPQDNEYNNMQESHPLKIAKDDHQFDNEQQELESKRDHGDKDQEIKVQEGEDDLRNNEQTNKAEQEEQDQKLVKQQKNFTNFIQFLSVINHELLNVYNSYEKLSRPTRSCLVYLTLIMSLAITLYFGNNLSFVRSLILSVLSGVFGTIIILTLKSSLSAENFMINIIGIVIFLASAGFFIFVVLAVIATTDSVAQTNIWAIQYTIQLVYNNTVGAIIGVVIKYMIS